MQYEEQVEHFIDEVRELLKDHEDCLDFEGCLVGEQLKELIKEYENF